jgi:hypothetical protein
VRAAASVRPLGRQTNNQSSSHSIVSRQILSHAGGVRGRGAIPLSLVSRELAHTPAGSDSKPTSTEEVSLSVKVRIESVRRDRVLTAGCVGDPDSWIGWWRARSRMGINWRLVNPGDEASVRPTNIRPDIADPHRAEPTENTRFAGEHHRDSKSETGEALLTGRTRVDIALVRDIVSTTGPGYRLPAVPRVGVPNETIPWCDVGIESGNGRPNAGLATSTVGSATDEHGLLGGGMNDARHGRLPMAF